MLIIYLLLKTETNDFSYYYAFINQIYDPFFIRNNQVDR